MLKIEINRGGTYVDITESILVQSCRLNYQFGNDEFRYAPDLFDLAVKGLDIDLINYFLHQHLPVEIRVTSDTDNRYYFNGYVKPSNQIDIENDYGDLSLSCVDALEVDLELPCPKLVEINSDLNTIATKIVANAGIRPDFPVDMNRIYVPYFVIEEDEDESLRALDGLLWEYGYTLYQKHARTKIASARSWFHLVTDSDVKPGNIFDVDKDNQVLEPLGIVEEEIVEQIISVDWIVATHITRVEGENDCAKGALLFMHSRSTSEKGVAPIEAEGIWPVDGLTVPTWYRYSTRGLRDIVEDSDQRLRIIHGFNQCVTFVAESDDSGVESDDIVVEFTEHSSKRSRVVFKNNNMARAIRLRGFQIRGSAIYQQGTYTVLGGIYTEPFEFISGAVVRATDYATYQLPAGASDQDNFYNNWRLRSENGTNVIISDYDGTSKIARTESIRAIAPQDIAGSKLIITSPVVGLKESNTEAKHLYEVGDAKRFCFGLINLIEFGRYQYAFDLMQSRQVIVAPVADTNPPTYVNSNVVGNRVALQYNEPLDETSIPSSSNYVVDIDGVTEAIEDIAISDNFVLIYLEDNVESAQVVRLFYTAPDGDEGVKDISGNKAADLANILVINSTARVINNLPPELVRTTVRGYVLILLYDKELDEDNTPDVNDYTVRVDGEVKTISSLSVSGRTVTLTLTTPVMVGQTVEVDYRPTNSVRDLFGNLAEALVAQAVDNLTEISLVSSVAARNTARLTFSEPLDAESAPDGSAFTVAYTPTGQPEESVTVSRVSIVDRTVLLTLGTDIRTGSTLISYDKPDAKPLSNYIGTRVDSFDPVESGDRKPPVLSHAQLMGNRLILNFNEELDPESVPALSDFGLDIEGSAESIQDISVNGQQVVITLPQDVGSGMINY